MEDVKEEEKEAARQYREFQNRQVQSLLELREAQADAETERRLEHLKQVRGLVVQARGAGLLGGAAISPVLLAGSCIPRLSSGSGRLSWTHIRLSSRG